MFHLLAYTGTEAASGTLNALTPVPDPTVTINTNDIQVPDKVNQLLLAAGIDASGAGTTENQLQSPSLREVFFPSLTPVQLGATFNGYERIYDLSQNPLQLKTNEGLEFWSDGGGTGPLRLNGLIWLGDGKVAQANGNMYTMRGTATVQQSATAWANGAITFGQTLPVGNYDIVGMRVEGTGLLAARLIFQGTSAVTRPGVPGVANAQSGQFEQFRFGRMGVFGSFASTNPPSLEVFGGTAAAQNVYFDLVPK